MSRWWLGLALATTCVTTSAWAQAPAPAAPAPVAEPLPFTPPQHVMPPPPGMGGMGRMGGQPGPGIPPYTGDPNGPPLLPPDLPNAFTRRPTDECDAWYSYVGAMWLRRQRLGHGPVAYRDASPIDTVQPPNLPPALAAAQSPVANFNDLNPDYTPGIRATLGYHWDCQAIEVNGYYLSGPEATQLYAAPGRLNLLFTNPPVGFEGNNNLWRHADGMRLGFKNYLINGEANYRWWLGYETPFSWLVGFRYFSLRERLSIYVDDEASILDQNGQPDPRRQADYVVTPRNRMVLPQIGFEYNKPLFHFLALSCGAKGAWGLNFVNTEIILERGDGLVGIDGKRSDTNFGQLYDMGMYLDWRLTTRARLRTGYNAMFVLGVTEAVDQVDYDLTQTFGERRDQGSIFYHGPMVELQVVY